MKAWRKTAVAIAIAALAIVGSGVAVAGGSDAQASSWVGTSGREKAIYWSK